MLFRWRHPHPLADVHLVRVTADDVGGQSQSMLLVELDDRDRIRLLTGDPLLDVDRACGHRAIAAHHCGRELGRKALWAWMTGWMDVETTAAAPQYPQLVVCAGFPEERRERIERTLKLTPRAQAEVQRRTREDSLVVLTP